MTLDVLVYADNAADRMVFISGQKYVEGRTNRARETVGDDVEDHPRERERQAEDERRGLAEGGRKPATPLNSSSWRIRFSTTRYCSPRPKNGVLIERLKEVNGVARVGDNVAANIDHARQAALRRQELERVDKDFLRRPGQKLLTFRTPGDGVERPSAWIPVEEIQLAVLHIVEDQFGCQRGAPPKAVAELFGFDRTPSGLAELVATAVDMLVDEKRLQASGPNVYLL